MTDMDINAWIGRSRERRDAMDPWAAAALIATLNLARAEPAAGDALPPFWHWLYFREAAPRGALGPDGHPAKGGFLPPAPQPRRMWAGGRLALHAPLPLGAPATRRETIADVRRRTGRAGPLTFVTVRHEVAGAAGLAAVEEQDIVYREDPAGFDAPTPPEARRDETHARAWTCDATVLFRYSALTFNGHKIHYDLAHAREVEGYPGLVVHGPLLATLLLELAHEIAVELSPRARVAGMAFRAIAPIFANEPFAACARPEGEGLALWIRGADGRQAMAMEATLTPG